MPRKFPQAPIPAESIAGHHEGMHRSRLLWNLGVPVVGLVFTALVILATNAHRWRGDNDLGGALAWLVVLLTAAAAVILYFVLRRPIGRLRNLGDAVEAMADGQFEHRVPVDSDDELGVLARSLNEACRNLGQRFSHLHESGERRAAVLSGMAEGVVAVDNQRRVLFANSAAGRLFEFLPPSIEGRPLLEVIRDHTLEQAVAQVLQSRQPLSFEIEQQGESLRTLAVQVSPLPGSDEVGAVVVLHDNTELRRLETIRQEFIANVSHELKTPLSSIMAYTETLQRGALDDPEHREQFLSRIAEQGERLHNLIQDMLSLARIETAKQPFEIVAVDLAKIVQRCLEDYSPQAKAKSIDLALTGDLPNVRVRADEEGMRVICSNLVDNAIKYTPDGGRVDLSWKVDDGRVRVEVADTGLGIPRSDVARVFERFFRVDKARSRELGSTGLGLAIVKHLAQSFGGTVGVESQAGQGSRFWVELPLA